MPERSFDDFVADEATARKLRRERLVRLNTRWVPAGRVFGFAIIALGFYAYQRLVVGDVDHELFFVFCGILAAYAAGSWLFLRRFYSPESRVDSGLVFLVGDLFVFGLTCLHTGAEQSPAALLFFVRVADQLLVSSSRALFFAFATVVTYLGMVGVAEIRDFGPDWKMAAVVAFTLLGGNLYVALTGRQLEVLRRRSRAAIRVARTAITDLRNQTTTLEAALGDAEQAAKAKARFLATMSHEIRTPLNGIIGTASLLRAQKLDPPGDHYAELLRSSAESLLELVDDILDFSKIDAGELVLDSHPFDLSQLVEEVRSLVEPEARRKDLELTCDAQGIRGVVGDRGRLRQVLLNLVTNAVKFTEDGSVRISARREDPTERRDLVRFAVADTGIGISTEFAADLFEEFTQADGEPGIPKAGSGLGLAISQRLVTAMGGRLEVDSTVGVGSTFFFDAVLPPAASDLEEHVSGRFDGRGRSVLVVEDDPVSRLVAAATMKELGFEVTTAENGREALDLLAQSPFDLVLMDCQMPVLDGWEATEKIRSLPDPAGETPIVALTAFATTEEKRKCLEVGMDDYLTKPLRRDRLLAALRRWLPGTGDASQEEGPDAKRPPG